MTGSRVTASDDPAEVVGLPVTRFAAIVALDVKGKLEPDVAAVLRHPLVAGRWYEALVAMKVSAEGVLSARQLETRATRRSLLMSATEIDGPAGRFEVWRSAELVQREHERWKVGTVRFLTSVEQRLAEARGLLRNDCTQCREVRRRVVQLEDAITRHASELSAEDATDQVLQLWLLVGA